MSEVVDRVKAAIRRSIEGSEHNFGEAGIDVVCADAAEAAIEALRQPTEEMTEVGRQTRGVIALRWDAAEVWRAMVDAALKGDG